MTENILVKKLEQLVNEWKESGKTEDVILNALKQELHYYVLDFVYNHPEYSSLVMYGGTLLRIVYRLPRMSEDLDFQSGKKNDLEKFKVEIIKYFESRYNFSPGVIIKSRPEHDVQVMFITFDILKGFHFKNISWTTLRIRFDINFFKDTDKFITETHPIVHEGIVFSILTYPLSTLMASKIGAVLQRTKRGIADKITDCKPRDIYDLLWYMERRVIPDLEYLKAKGEKYDTLYDLFYSADMKKGLKLRVSNLSDDLFETDLAQFFFDRTDFDGWIYNWRQKFLTLLESYRIYKLINLNSISFEIDFSTRNRIVHYFFETDEKYKTIQFTIQLTDYWFEFNDVKIEGDYRVKEIEAKIESTRKLTDLDYEYVGFFYKKIKEFIQKNKDIVLQDHFKAKVIRATADNLKPDKEIFLDKKLLKRIQFEELM